jgi:D-alanyl-D-alanine carboxypeptidase/D-alanyl-D-alanine-endopeptidase (penicillin-binding protein 4)
MYPCRRGLTAVVASVWLAVTGCAGRSIPTTAPPTPSAARGDAGVPTPAGHAAHLAAVFDAAPDTLTTWSALFTWADTGEVIYARDPDRRLLPASNMKLVTLATAAHRLGWPYRFPTTLSAVAPVDGTVHGNLYVRGSGDPTLGWPTDAADLALREWARALRARGVVRIEGDLVGDPDAYGDDRLGDNWSWNDLTFGYAAPYAGLTFHENTVAVTVEPSPRAGVPAQVRIAPDGSGLEVDAEVQTVAPDTPTRLTLHRPLGSHVLHVRGEAAAGAVPVVRYVAVPDPARFFLEALRRALAVEGIDVRGTTRVEALAADVDGGVRVVHQSAPLADIAVRFMKVSQNLYGEALLHAVDPQPTATLASRRAAVASALTDLGVPTDDIQVADGSGLSRRNFVSASTLVALLRALSAPAHRETFVRTLPIAGVDGTLEQRLRGTACEGRVRAKTGTLSHARALSGYVATASGRDIIFSVLANNHLRPTSDVDAVVDDALVGLCR